MVQEEVIENIRRNLYEKRAGLQKNLSSSLPQRDKIMDIDNYEPDPDADHYACSRIFQKLIAQIDKTLNLLETQPDMYGICEVCGKFIPEERLNFFPEATSCVNCLKKVSVRVK